MSVDGYLRMGLWDYIRLAVEKPQLLLTAKRLCWCCHMNWEHIAWLYQSLLESLVGRLTKRLIESVLESLLERLLESLFLSRTSESQASAWVVFPKDSLVCMNSEFVEDLANRPLKYDDVLTLTLT